MKYEREIEAAFKVLGFESRGKQPQTVNAIVCAFLDDGKKNVIVDAPTGAGKSLIGAVAAEVISHHRRDNPNNAIFLSSTNILLDQYQDSFNHAGFMTLKGAENYICELKTNGPVKFTADNCLKSTKFYDKNDPVTKAVCGRCEFAHTRALKNNVKNLITNYAYYFLDRMFINDISDNGLKPRNIVIWDEAHLINESYVNHCTIFFSKERFDEYLKDITRYMPDRVNEYTDRISPVIEMIVKERIHLGNIKPLLGVIAKFYMELRNEFETRSKQAEDHATHLVYKKLYDKYKNMFCKINNFVTHDFEIVIDSNKYTKELKVDPIFISSMFPSLVNGEFNLFLSGTVSKEFLAETLSLNDSETAFIRAENEFPIENKTVVVRKDYLMKLNYTTLQDITTYHSLGSKIKNILHQHKNESGVLFAPSFAFAKTIKEMIGDTHDIVIHQEGPLLPILEGFKKNNNLRPSIIISPSMFEGVDLPGDVSRFQIMAKAPYASLGDKRMKHILDHHPEMYKIMTIMKVVQGIGRSTRYPGDHCRTYFLDQNLKYLFENPSNIWQNQFLMSYC